MPPTFCSDTQLDVLVSTTALVMQQVDTDWDMGRQELDKCYGSYLSTFNLEQGRCSSVGWLYIDSMWTYDRALKVPIHFVTGGVQTIFNIVQYYQAGGCWHWDRVTCMYWSIYGWACWSVGFVSVGGVWSMGCTPPTLLKHVKVYYNLRFHRQAGIHKALAESQTGHICNPGTQVWIQYCPELQKTFWAILFLL